MENHAAYVQSWLQAMQNDPKYIFDAASQASKAADFILSFSRAAQPADETAAAA
jgi:antirestriction protein ArdC